MSTVPRPTAAALISTLAVTSAALASFAARAPIPASAYLLVFTLLFATRVAGQVVVGLFRPGWLPPMEEWNFVPYRILLPAQIALLALMGALVLDLVPPGQTAARVFVVGAFVYWAAMAARYAVRMARRPADRWLGGTIPIVFHCVLAAFLFVLGVSHVA